MALTGPFLDRMNIFERVQGFNLNRVVDFLNTFTSYNGAFYLPTSTSGALPPSNFGTIPLKFDEKTPTGTGTVTFTLPTGFTHVSFKGQVRSTVAAATENLDIHFNGDTGANYVQQQLFGNNNAASSSQGTAGTADSAVVFVVGSTATANIGSSFTIEVPNYSGTTFIKEAMGHSQAYSALTAAGEFILFRGIRWNNTAAVTSIELKLATGNYATGSKISGYVWP